MTPLAVIIIINVGIILVVIWLLYKRYKYAHKPFLEQFSTQPHLFIPQVRLTYNLDTMSRSFFSLNNVGDLYLFDNAVVILRKQRYFNMPLSPFGICKDYSTREILQMFMTADVPDKVILRDREVHFYINDTSQEYYKTTIKLKNIDTDIREKLSYTLGWGKLDATGMVGLLRLLDEAEKLASEFSGGYSNKFLSAEEFHEALAESVQKLKRGDKKQLEILWSWFAPTCSWDDFVGKPGMHLANAIYNLIDKELKG